MALSHDATRRDVNVNVNVNVMSVAEVIAVRGGLTDLQVAQVTAYYKAKYNLP